MLLEIVAILAVSYMWVEWQRLSYAFLFVFNLQGRGDGLPIDRSGLHDNWDDAEGYYSKYLLVDLYMKILFLLQYIMNLPTLLHSEPSTVQATVSGKYLMVGMKLLLLMGKVYFLV